MEIAMRLWGNTTNKFKWYYLTLFIAFGAMAPLLSVFYQTKHLSGYQIGVLMGIGPVLSLIFQPVWGMICDRYDGQKKVLYLTLIASGIIGLLYPFGSSYSYFIFLAFALGIFQCALNPVSDSLTLYHVHTHGGDYGRIRLWGSLGFAGAAWLAGYLSELTSINAIFVTYALALFVSVRIAMTLPKEGAQFSTNIFQGLGRLLRIRKLVLFLIATFLMYGTMNANNVYLGILYQKDGGSVVGVGLAFLLGAGSEAPIMQLSGRWIKSYSIGMLLLVSTLICCFRWILFSFPLPAWAVLAVFFLQGLSIGLFLPVAAIFIRRVAPADMQATAQGLYAAIGSGLGSMTCSFIGGIILDRFGIYSVYRFFALLTLLGAFGYALLWYGMRKRVL
jgi:PPP family 3-phenylpropionic acid transporter